MAALLTLCAPSSASAIYVCMPYVLACVYVYVYAYAYVCVYAYAYVYVHVWMDGWM